MCAEPHLGLADGGTSRFKGSTSSLGSSNGTNSMYPAPETWGLSKSPPHTHPGKSRLDLNLTAVCGDTSNSLEPAECSVTAEDEQHDALKLETYFSRSQAPSDCSTATYYDVVVGYGGLTSKLNWIAQALLRSVLDGKVLVVSRQNSYSDPRRCPRRRFDCTFKPLSPCESNVIKQVHNVTDKAMDNRELNVAYLSIRAAVSVEPLFSSNFSSASCMFLQNNTQSDELTQLMQSAGLKHWNWSLEWIFAQAVHFVTRPNDDLASFVDLIREDMFSGMPTSVSRQLRVAVHVRRQDKRRSGHSHRGAKYHHFPDSMYIESLFKLVDDKKGGGFSAGHVLFGSDDNTAFHFFNRHMLRFRPLSAQLPRQVRTFPGELFLPNGLRRHPTRSQVMSFEAARTVSWHYTEVIKTGEKSGASENCNRSHLRNIFQSNRVHFTNDFYSEDSEWKVAIAHDGMLLEYAPQHMQGNLQVVTTAVSQNGLALQWATELMRGNKEVVRIACSRNTQALVFAHVTLRKDLKFIEGLIRQNGAQLQHVAKSLRRNETIVRLAVATDALTLKYAEAELSDSRPLVLMAVKNNGLALKFASSRLQDDAQIVHTAVTQNRDAAKYASTKMQKKIQLEGEIVSSVEVSLGSMPDATFELPCRPVYDESFALMSQLYFMAESGAIILTSTSNVGRIMRSLAIAMRARSGDPTPIQFLDLDGCRQSSAYHGCPWVQPPPLLCAQSKQKRPLPIGSSSKLPAWVKVESFPSCSGAPSDLPRRCEAALERGFD